MPNSPILGIPQVAENQNQKEVTINDGIQSLEGATQDVLSVDFSAGNVTLTDDQFNLHHTFQCTGQTASRRLTVPTQKRVFAVTNLGTYAITVRKSGGADTLVVPGSTRIIVSDGDLYAPDTPYELKTTYPSTPAGSALMLADYLTRSVVFAANFAGSRFYALTAPTADYDIDVQINGVSVGTIHFAAGVNTATFTSSGGAMVVCASGDRLTLIGAATPDATIAGIFGTLAGVR